MPRQRGNVCMSNLNLLNTILYMTRLLTNPRFFERGLVFLMQVVDCYVDYTKLACISGMENRKIVQCMGI